MPLFFLLSFVFHSSRRERGKEDGRSWNEEPEDWIEFEEDARRGDVRRDQPEDEHHEDHRRDDERRSDVRRRRRKCPDYRELGTKAARGIGRGV